VIAVDPHKASWTAAAVNATLRPLASIRVPVSRDGYRALRGFARQRSQADQLRQRALLWDTKASADRSACFSSSHFTRRSSSCQLATPSPTSVVSTLGAGRRPRERFP
jgi:hypothetical protein